MLLILAGIHIRKRVLLIKLLENTIYGDSRLTFVTQKLIMEQ